LRTKDQLRLVLLYVVSMSAKVHSQTTIAASPERIWAILTDFPSYPSWNPFVKAISGNVEPRSRLAVRIAPSGGNGMVFKPVIAELQVAAVPGMARTLDRPRHR
jgi:hypothetical protein